MPGITALQLLLLSWVGNSESIEFARTANSELKVCVLGNGGIGKTQMCRRLRAEPLDANVSSARDSDAAKLSQLPAVIV